MEKYSPKDIEKKWQDKWEEEGLHTVDLSSDKEKYYSLVEFPYPSGNLHVGHWYAFAVPDIRARFKKMQGYNVLFPFGFDSFGLPAENAAIQRGLDPKDWTESNMAVMREQFKQIGSMVDWSKTVATSDPAFYRWTQWMFARFFENNLAYRAKTMVNWCPSCLTVLANEQVVQGECERCGALVEKKEMSQWMLKITDYADQLIDDLEELDWPKDIKESQKNWIGRSSGAELSFEVREEEPLRFVFVHGYRSGPDLNFHPWIKSELEKRGHVVEIPSLPNPRNPSVQEQVEYVLNSVEFDERTILVGHSLGTNVVMKLLEKIDRPIHRTVLVGGFIDDNFAKKEDRRSIGFDFEFDFETIQKNAGQVILLHGENEETITDLQFSKLQEALSGYVVIAEDIVEHFRHIEEPAVLRAVLPHVNVFTTRPDTLFGVTYLVLAPENKLIDQLRFKIKNWKELETYRKEAASKTDLDRQQSKDKTGVRLEGVVAINPGNKEEIPVYVADYVLEGYGTGAIMAVPAHDERDFAFAKKFNLPIKQVIAPQTGIERENEEFRNGGAGVVFDPISQKYAVAKWLDHGGALSFYAGGVDEGEDVKTAVVREVKEESGLYDFKEIYFVETSYTRYYNKLKNVNRVARAECYLFILNSVDKKEVTLEEHENFELVWASAEDILTSFRSRNEEGETDHYIRFLMESVGLARELGYDKVTTSEEFTRKALPVYGKLENSGQFDGLSSEEAKIKITEFVGGRTHTTYKQRDWGISRQRYWGTPIPIVYDPEGVPHAVPDEYLPWVLPTDVDYKPDGVAPLDRSLELRKRTVSIFGKGWTPEVDTMDTFVDSAWYFMRYLDSKNDNSFAGGEILKKWLPVDMYSGGSEHTTMHVLYSRFWYKALASLGYVPGVEPYDIRINRGLIMGPDGKKMSKSKGNVVDPDIEVERFGADSMRVYLAFIGPYNEVGHFPWNTDGLAGARRFLEKVWRIAEKVQPEDNGDLNKILHQTVKKVGSDLENLKTNTAVAQLMTCATVFDRSEKVGISQYRTLLMILAPFAPHITEELWSLTKGESFVHLNKWPEYQESFLVEDEVTMAIQINGKLRETIKIPFGLEELEVQEIALENEKVKKYVPNSKEIKRFVFVKNKLVNIVI